MFDVLICLMCLNMGLAEHPSAIHRGRLFRILTCRDEIIASTDNRFTFMASNLERTFF